MIESVGTFIERCQHEIKPFIKTRNRVTLLNGLNRKLCESPVQFVRCAVECQYSRHVPFFKEWKRAIRPAENCLNHLDDSAPHCNNSWRSPAIKMSTSQDSSRRDFLTGRAVQKELQRVGEEIAEAIIDIESKLAAPLAGDTVRLETKAMGCPWCVIMNPGPPRQVMVASDAFDVIHDVEQMLTIYREDSDVAQLNREASADWLVVRDELFHFLERCRALHQATAGAFDPAMGALIQLWREARLQGRLPDPRGIAAALERSGFQHVSLIREEESLVKYERDGLVLDFAAIGKGYGIDRAAEHLRAEGVENFLVHGGQSSLFAAGRHHDHDGWPVGLKNPLFTEKRYATLLLKDCGMGTSGSNIQYFRYGGQRYGHLIDPRTGWPAEGLLSVTVIAPTATEADALSTAFYAMGLDNALRYCDDHPEIGAVLIPTPTRGRVLEPVVRNFPAERLFYEKAVIG